MNYYLKQLFIIALLITSVACSNSVSRDEPTIIPPDSPPAIHIEPSKDESKLEKLQREKQEALATIASEKQRVVALTAAIKQVELDNISFWSKVVGGVAGGLATLCLILSFITISYPLASPFLRYCSYTLGAVSVLAFTVPVVYTYLLPVGFLAMAVLLTFGALSWFRSHTATLEVVRGVEELKTAVPHYREIMRKHVGRSSDKLINFIRKV